MGVFILTQYNSCLGNNRRASLKVYRHTLHPRVFSSHTNSTLLSCLLHLSTLCSLALLPPTWSTPDVWQFHIMSVNSKSEGHVRLHRLSFLFSPRLLLKEASGFVFSNKKVEDESFQRFCWYKISLLKSRLGGKVEIVEISNKTESVIWKEEMLLDLIMIYCSVDFGCTLTEPHWDSRNRWME